MHVTTLYSNSINVILFSFYIVSVKIARLAAIRDIIKRSRYAWLLSLSKRSLFCSFLFLSKYFNVIFISRQINIYAKQKYLAIVMASMLPLILAET